MIALDERRVEVNGQACRVWELGRGPRIGYLAGLGGLRRPSPFLLRLAEKRRVVVPSIPGFPGARGHDLLDDTADWVAMVLDLLERAELAGCDLIAASVGGMLLAEAACFCPHVSSRLVLIAPFGLFDSVEPVADVFAQRGSDVPSLLSARPARLADLHKALDGEDDVEWHVTTSRANEAAARLLWPLGDRGLERRLHRIGARTLLVWGDSDRVVPVSYADRFAQRLRDARVHRIPAAGHLADIDAPSEVADVVEAFLAEPL